MRPVRSNHSNPALKQDVGKARFWQKEYYPHPLILRRRQTGVEIVFAKPWQAPPGCLAGRRPCFCQSLSRYLRQIGMNGFLGNSNDNKSYWEDSVLECLELCLVRDEPKAIPL